MCDPNVPNEILVMDIEGMYNEGRFVMGTPLGTQVTLSMSFHALQRLVKYAIKAGIFTVNGDISYYENGELRRKHGAKDKAVTA